MSVSSATINGLVKEVYDDRTVEDIQNKETVTRAKLRKSPKKPSGDGFTFSVNLQGNQKGQGAQNELEALRTPGSQVLQKGKIYPKVFSHTIRLSGLSMEIAKNDEDSFADNATFQMDNGIGDAAKELNAQIFRDGTGRIAQVNGAVVASADVIFDNGVPTHFKIGMEVDIFNGGGTKQVSARTVEDVDIENNTITLDQAVSCDNDGFIYRSKVNDNAPVGGKEYSGLRNATDDGTIANTYENISRVDYPNWDGITINAGGANLSNDMLQRAISRVKIFSNGKMVKKVVSNTSQMRKYLNILTPLKRFDSKSKMDSGHEEVPTWNGKEWIEDTDCGFDEVFGISPEYFEKFIVYDLKFDDTDGSVFKWDSGFDAFIGYAKEYGNYGARVPNAHFRIRNAAVPQF